MWKYQGPTTFEQSNPSMSEVKATSVFVNDADGSSFTLQLVAPTMNVVSAVIAEWISSANAALAAIGEQPTEEALKVQIIAASQAIADKAIE